MDDFGTWDSEEWLLLESVGASDCSVRNDWGSLPQQVAFASAYPCLPLSTVHDESDDDTWQTQPNMFGTRWVDPRDTKDMVQGEVEYPVGPREPLLVTTAVGEPVDEPFNDRGRPQQKNIRKQTKKSLVTKGTLSLPCFPCSLSVCLKS